MAKKLSDDFLKWTLDIDGKPAMKAMGEWEQRTKQLSKENEGLNKQMAILKAHGKENTDEFKKLDKQYKTNNSTIREAKKRMGELRKEVGLNGLNAVQLRSRMKELKRQMDATVPNSKAWKQHNSDLKATQTRYAQVQGGIKKTNGVFGAFKTLAPWLGVTAVAGALKSVWNNAVETRKEFARYLAVLKVAYGSQEKADAVFKNLQQFAAETPFQLSELTGAFVKLKNYGLEPSMDEMRRMGDLASSVGKGFDQLAEAEADAVTGEFERLKEFGIKAKKEGDKITFTFKEQATQIDNNAESIKKYIGSLGDMEGVKGSMAEISKTIGGAASNAQDATDSLFNVIGKKLEPSLVKIYGAYARIAGVVSDWVDGGQVQSLEDERLEVNRLVIKLKESNISEETRKTLLEDLRKLAPDVAKSIGDEKTDLKALSIALEAYNSQMALKILMKKQDLAIDKQKGKVGTYQELTAEHEAEMIDAITKSVDWFKKKAPEMKDQIQGIIYDDNLETIKKAEKLNSLALQATTLGNKDLFHAIDSFKSFRNAYAQESSMLDDMTENAAKMLDKYKKIIGEKQQVAEEDNNNTDGEGGGGEEDIPKKYEDQLKALAKFQKEQKLALKEDYANGVLDKEQYNAALLTLDVGYYTDLVKLQEANNKDALDSKSSLLDAQVKLMESAQKTMADLESDAQKNMAEAMEQDLAAELEILDAQTAAVGESLNKSTEQSKQALTAAQGIFEEARQLKEEADALAFNDLSLREQQDAELAFYQQKLDQQKISEEQFQIFKTDIDKDYTSKRIKNAEQYFAIAGDLSNSLAGFYEAAENRKLNAIEKQVEQGAISEEEGTRRKEAIQEKYAKKQQKIAIAQAIINGGLAIMRIAADVPKVDFGIMTGILIAAQAIATASQVAVIKSQGFADGGHTGQGGKYEVAGTVHKGEYVIPQEGVNNPALRPFIDMIEAQRQNQSLSSMFNPFLTAPAPSRGFAEGGYTSDIKNGQQTPDDSEMMKIMLMMAETTMRLNQNIERGIGVKYYGSNGIKDANEKHADMQSNLLGN